MINETIQSTIEVAKSNAYSSSLWILWISFVISMPLVASFFKGNKGWGKFWGIWFFTTVITGIILTFLLLAPNIISDFSIKLTEFFS
jgi:uncharacterized membrane protein